MTAVSFKGKLPCGSGQCVASAYVIDKKANEIGICAARYNFQNLTANNGDGVQLPSDIGRPLLTEPPMCAP